MTDLHIVVSNKIATYFNRDGNIVCGNSCYQIVFSFDAEWDAYPDKTARFIWGDNYLDVPFTGNIVAVPILYNTSQLRVGVYAGDLCTTTAAAIACTSSILCQNGLNVYQPPASTEPSGGTGSSSGQAMSNTITAISVTESEDGTITIINDLKVGSEKIVIGTDWYGVPTSISYNDGPAITIEGL